MRISDWSSDVCSSDLDPESLRDHIKEVISAYTLDRRLWPKARAGQLTHEVVFDGRAGRVGLHQKHFAAHILQSNISRGRQKVPIGQSDEDSLAPQILSMTPRQPRIAWNNGGIQTSVQHAGSIRLRRGFLELQLNIGKASMVGVER